jgi:hypothetical protein
MSKEKILVIALLLLMTGCSNAPSQLDIENSVKTNWGIMGCERIILKSAKKENIIPGADSNHIYVQTNITIEFVGSGNDSAESILADRTSSYVSIVNKMEDQTREDRKLRDEAKNNPLLIESAIAANSRVMQAIFKVEDNLKELEDKALNQMLQSYRKGCAKSPEHLIRKTILNKVDDFKNPIQFKTDARMPMIKTENGWIFQSE